MNLVAGKPVKFRRITVHVKFKDGTPMTTAVVECTGAPRDPSDLRWRYERKVDAPGTIEFLAPVNRQLRIEIKDWYRRPLNAVYISTHRPGASPITQSFVITP